MYLRSAFAAQAICAAGFSRIAPGRLEPLKSRHAMAETYNMRIITTCKVHQIRRF